MTTQLSLVEDTQLELLDSPPPKPGATPGPWSVVPHGESRYEVQGVTPGGHGKRVAVVDTLEDARAIAALPDLLSLVDRERTRADRLQERLTVATHGLAEAYRVACEWDETNGAMADHLRSRLHAAEDRAKSHLQRNTIITQGQHTAAPDFAPRGASDAEISASTHEREGRK